MRHLFQKLDGPTTGDKSFYGPIGKAIQSCEKLAFVQFEPIVDGEGLPELSPEVLHDLSNDQQYLYTIILSIREGNVSDRIARQKPGPLSHSRWLTLANRVCRLYVSTPSPDRNLKAITHFIVTNYGPNWFAIKTHPTITDAPKHIHHATQLTKCLPDDVVNIVKPFIMRNAYFAHPENTILAMLGNSCPYNVIKQ